MAQEALVSERKAKSDRAIHVRLTPKGNKYRERLIKARIDADKSDRYQRASNERATLLRFLKLITELESQTTQGFALCSRLLVPPPCQSLRKIDWVVRFPCLDGPAGGQVLGQGTLNQPA